MNRSSDWFAQAQADLFAARDCAAQRHYEWAAFAAQQAAEKALKAVHLSLGTVVVGHSARQMLHDLARQYSVSPEVEQAAKRLDRHYTAARCPDVHPGGTPQDYYGAPDAEAALDDARAVVDWCDEILQSRP